ncbi:uncharacterized protein LOC141904676 [Tubulanus polymorphus]|uniref:uncharacterized protein LOC141904676 n=1 Tax=Tubulanus polymorphus TaxID=672921 RepID=UPI003DA1FDCE
MKFFVLATICLMAMDQSEGVSRKWLIMVPMESQYSLDCNPLLTKIVGSMEWLLPNGTSVSDGWSDSNRKVSSGTFSITKMEKSFNGLYHCVVNGTNGTIITKWGLNYFEFSTMKELLNIDTRTIVAFVSAIIFGLLVLIPILLRTFIFNKQEPSEVCPQSDDPADPKPHSSHVESGNGETNDGFENDTTAEQDLTGTVVEVVEISGDTEYNDNSKTKQARDDEHQNSQTTQL